MKGKLLLAVVLGSSVAFATNAVTNASGAVKAFNNVNPVLAKSYGLQKKVSTIDWNNLAKKNRVIQKAAAAEGDVSYALPSGYFYFGMELQQGGYSLKENELLAPAYVDCTFINTSKDEDGSWEYEWQYLDPASIYSGEGQIAISNDINLTVGYPGGYIISAPALSVGDVSYQKAEDVNIGGNTVVQFADFEQPSTLGAVLYNIGVENSGMGSFGAAGNVSNDSYLSMYREQIDKTYGEGMGEQMISSAKVTGVGTLYDLGDATCSLNSIEVAFFNGTGLSLPTDDKKLRINVYKVNVGEDGKYSITDDLLTYGECTWGKGNKTAMQYLNILTFPMMTIDETMGDYESPVTITGPFYAVIEGLDDESLGDVIVSCVSQTFSAQDYLNYGIMPDLNVTAYANVAVTMMGEVVEMIDTPANWLYYMDKEKTTLMVAENYLMNLDLSYNWLESDSYTYNAPVAGGSNVFELATNLAAEELYVREDEDMTLPDWLSFTIEDGAEVGTAELTVEAEALPADVAGRSATLTLYGNGAEKVFTVRQGEAGVEAVETSANRVSVVNGNFEVEAAGATSVDVYNVAGQKVASAAIEGTTVVPAQDLAKGLYILKFNDNTAVKVMK